jgi:hypothetical protein
VQQPLVLAIEPDLRQANIVKRIVREQALADVAVVDSLDAAIEAMRTAMPDVLLLSALLSPRDEDELIAHLKTLDNAGHLQTHTIPQLASALRPEGGKARGLLSAFRRKKDPEPVAAGCDPDLFADEIRLFLQRAAEKKRELQYSDHVAPDMRPSAAGATRAAKAHAQAPVETTDSSSSWSSPFEWKPSNPSSLISNPYSRVVSPEEAAIEHGAATNAPEAADPEPLIAPSAAAEFVYAESAIPEPVTMSAESIAAEEPIYADPVHVDAPPVYHDTPVSTDAPLHAEIDVDTPHLADAPVHTDAPVHFDAPIYRDAPAHVEVPLYSEVETPVYVDAPIHVEAYAPMRDSGSRDQRSRNRDTRLGVLASWMRAERMPPSRSDSADDLRALLGSLAIPTAVAAVAYPRGVRIRRVRVPAAREPRLTEPAGAVILSKRLLAEQRERRTSA